MKYNEAINMATAAVVLDKNLSVETRVEIIAALARTEELADIGEAMEKWFECGNSIYNHQTDFPICVVEELLDWAEEASHDS